MSAKNKETSLTFRLTEDEKKALESEAASFEPPTTVASYVRYLIATHPKRQIKKK